MTLIISWIAFFYLQFHQPNHFERRNSLPLPPKHKKRSPGKALSKYLFGYDAEQRKIEEERWEKRKQLICQQERLNKNVKRIVKENHHLLKENSHVTIVPSNSPTAIDAISTASFTAIKSSSKPLIKDNNQPAQSINRNKKSEKLNKENFEYYYLQFLILFACVNIYNLPFDLSLDS